MDLKSLVRTRTRTIALGTVLFLGVLYAILFSSWTQSLLIPTLEAHLSQTLKTPIHIEKLELDIDALSLAVRDESNNTLRTEIEFSLLRRSILGNYHIDLRHDGGINSFHLPLRLDGRMDGDTTLLVIKGAIEVFDGMITYHSAMRELKPSSLDLNLSGLAYEPLMHFLEYPSSTDTRIHAHAHIRGIDVRDITGSLVVRTTTHTLEKVPLKPKEEDNSTFDIRSFLADENGVIQPFKLSLDTQIHVDHLGILEQFAHMHLRNSLDANASFTANEKIAKGHIRTDFGHSQTDLWGQAVDFEPSVISLRMEHLSLRYLFDTLMIPSPISGLLAMEGQIDPQKVLLTLTITQGHLHNAILKRYYHITQPPLDFSTHLALHVLGNREVRYYGTLRSNLMRIELDDTITHSQLFQTLHQSLIKKQI